MERLTKQQEDFILLREKEGSTGEKIDWACDTRDEFVNHYDGL